MENNLELNLQPLIWEKKPISWLIRELEKQLAQGNDYVSLNIKHYNFPEDVDYFLNFS